MVLNISINLAAKNLERHDARRQHYVVVLAQREAIAERLLRLLTELDDLQLPHHVRAGLAGVHDIPLHLAGFDAVVDGLLPCPFLPMQTGVDHETTSAEQFRVELAQQSFRVAFIPAVLRGDALGVERPPFGDRGNAAERSELQKALEVPVFNLEGDVEMMS